MNKKIITAAVILLIVFNVPKVHAAEWRIDPAVRVAGEYDDIVLAPGSPAPVSRATQRRGRTAGDRSLCGGNA